MEQDFFYDRTRIESESQGTEETGRVMRHDNSVVPGEINVRQMELHHGENETRIIADRLLYSSVVRFAIFLH